jgi:hypothetical protein
MRTKTFLLVLFTLLVTSVFVRADYDVDVMGTDIGSVWGSGPYTADSVIGKAAVHSGLIAIGQRAIIRVQSLGNQSNYIGTTAHGITTNSYAPSWAAIAISYVGPGGVPPQVSLTIPSSVTVGATFTVTAHATDADGDLNAHSIRWQGVGLLDWWTISGSSASNNVSVTAPSTPGTIYFRTEANDVAGNPREGEWIAVTVVSPPDLPPATDITVPSSVSTNSSFSAPWTATDANGNLSQVAMVRQLVGSLLSTSASGYSASGTFNPTAPSTSGTAYYRSEALDTLGALGTSSWKAVVVTGVNPTVSVSPSSVQSGGTLTVSYNGAYPGSWIGLFVQNAPSTSPIMSYSPPSTSGSANFVLAEGAFTTGQNYEARLFQTSGYTPQAWSSVFQIAGTTTYTLTVDGGLGGASGLPYGSIREISATPPANQTFWGWTIVSGPGSIQSPALTPTYFTVGYGNATVKANSAGISVSPNPVVTGTTLSISYLGAPSTSSRVGLAVVGSSDATTILQSYVPNSGNGSLGFSITGSFLQGVSYEARLYLDGSNTVIARSANFTVTNAPGYNLEVEFGSGDGTGLASGVTRNLMADPPPIGQKFSHWSVVNGPGSLINATSPAGSFTMGTGNAKVRANYTTASYTDYPTVGSTSGGTVWGTDIYTSDSALAMAAVHAGLLAPGQSGTIRAFQIGSWPSFSGTTRNAVTTLSYSSYSAMQLQLVSGAPTYSLTVTGGTGGGSGFLSGSVHQITATPSAGQTFQNWTVTSQYGSVQNANASPTNLTMGPGNAVVVANFSGSSLTVSPNPVGAGAVLTAAYTGALNTSHWIGLYGVGFSNNSPYMIAYVPNAGSGTVNFTLNNYFVASGSYEARMFKDLAYTPGATSQPFTVTCTLTVNFGTGGASGLTQGAVRRVKAFDPAAGFVFKNWTRISGAGSFVSDIQAETDFTIGNVNTTIQANYVENVPPTTPGTLTAAAITQSSITLSWGASTDNIAVTGYQVFRNGAFLTTATGLTLTNSGLAFGTQYTFYIVAIDAAGNISAPSNTVSVRTLNTTQSDTQNSTKLNIHLPY